MKIKISELATVIVTETKEGVKFELAPIPPEGSEVLISLFLEGQYENDETEFYNEIAEEFVTLLDKLGF